MAIREDSEQQHIGATIEEILRRRAAELAQPTADAQPDARDEWGDVLVVRVGNDTLCLPTRFVREVALLGQILPLPGLPEFYGGVASLRSRIYGVVDASRLFGLGRVAEDNGLGAPAHGVIVHGPDPEMPETELALLVDAVHGVVGVKAADVAPVPEGVTEQLERYSYAMAKAAGKYGLVLDMEKLLSDEALRVDGAK